MSRPVPLMTSLTLTSANVAYQLYALLAAVNADAPKVCQDLVIQAPLTGAQVVYIGNSDVSSTQYGVALNATWSWEGDSVSSNLYDLQAIYVLSGTEGTAIHVGVLAR